MCSVPLLGDKDMILANKKLLFLDSAFFCRISRVLVFVPKAVQEMALYESGDVFVHLISQLRIVLKLVNSTYFFTSVLVRMKHHFSTDGEL